MQKQRLKEKKREQEKIMDSNKKEKRPSPRETSKSEHRNFVRGASQECEGRSVAKEVGRERGLNTPYVEGEMIFELKRLDHRKNRC